MEYTNLISLTSCELGLLAGDASDDGAYRGGGTERVKSRSKGSGCSELSESIRVDKRELSASSSPNFATRAPAAVGTDDRTVVAELSGCAATGGDLTEGEFGAATFREDKSGATGLAAAAAAARTLVR